MRKFLKKLYKNLIVKIFNLIYGKISCLTDPKNDKNILIDKIKDSNICKYNKNNYSIIKVFNGRVCTDFVENVAVISGNRIIDKFSYQQINGELKSAEYNSSLYRGTPYFKKKFNGKVLSLTKVLVAIKLFSLAFDILPKIKLFSKLYNIEDLNYLCCQN